MFEKLTKRGFQVEFSSHAEAILGGDFPEVASQLEEVLLDSTIPIEEIIGSGGRRDQWHPKAAQCVRGTWLAKTQFHCSADH
jgi:hypothetical protein